ncbi:hypothetical protein R3W88_014513 [Solanum pinnatisectum]|uniref:Uncharacterized protein n=1 Tax=Solanum pinnatisectum TaxID=50273 RepID=A0AAV9KU91_9SOLN|nr:hypothetical protein R3W88_014513 [Solanum pinnatisectum]
MNSPPSPLPTNLPTNIPPSQVMIDYFDEDIDLAYGNLFTIVSSASVVPLGDGSQVTEKDMSTRTIFAECDFLPVDNPSLAPGPRIVGSMAQLIDDVNVA